MIFFHCITQSSKESALHDYIARLEQQLFTLKKEREVLLESSEQPMQVPDDVLERHEEEIRVLQNHKTFVESELGRAKESILEYQHELREAQEAVAAKELELQRVREDLEQAEEDINKEVIELRIKWADSQKELEEKEVLIGELRDTNDQLLQEAQIWDERY